MIGDKRAGPETSFAYAYCHGFLSGRGSVKGQALRKTLRETGVDLNLLNLNAVEDDPGSITCSGAVEAVRAFHLEQKSVSGNSGLKLRLIGSSLGGFISARYAELYPDEVDRIFLLCPSFGLGTRAQNFGSPTEMAEWERTGARVFPLSTGGGASVPWAFVEEARLQTDFPTYRCPAAIVHGLRDEVVPAAVTRSLVEGRSGLALRTSAMFVEDSHALVEPSTMDLTAKVLADFFDLKAEDKEGTEGTVAMNENDASQRTVEVEAKFSAHDVDSLKEAVLAQGGQVNGEQVFTDVYWDTEGCELTERDWWLRSRAGRWELKTPSLAAGDMGEGVTAYREITSAWEIARDLEDAGFLGAPGTNILHGSSLDERRLIAAGFQAFASFRTNREKFRLKGFAVDIDRASFGHDVVEIETMSSPEEADLVSARDSLTAIALSVGAQREGDSGESIRGKLMEYMVRNCPRQMEALDRQRARQGKEG
eukprot:g9362.t1